MALQLLVLVSLLFRVNAGSSLWEPSMPALQARDDDLSKGAYLSLSENDSVETVDQHLSPSKRWVTVLEDGVSGSQLWPHRTVVYAYNSDEDKTAIDAYFASAKEKWYNAGLSEEGFKYEEITKEECTNRRHTCMIISQTSGASMTSLALQEIDYGRLAIPTMELNLNPELGHLDIAANIAHEIGHAWGLAHEHQNPLYWKHTSWKKDLVVFDADRQFNCKNLKDYDAAARQATRGIVQGQDPSYSPVERMCRLLNVAHKFKFFGAMNWIPYERHLDKFNHQVKEIDWHSIMLYPSRAGGKEDQPGGGRRQILVKENGDEIEPVLTPSDRDIKAIEVLYGYKSGVSGALLWDSKMAALFYKVRRNDPDSCTNDDD